MKFCSSLAALTLLACSGFAQNSAPSVNTDRAAARFLDQATWGPTPASVAQLQAMSVTDWLNAQFALNTSDLPDQPILNAQGQSNNNLAPIQAAFFQNAVTGQDQLRQRIAFVLSQIWIVSQTSGVSPAYAYPPYWRIFRDNAFGNYRDLIKAVTLSPAMGRYLSMANNKGNASKGTAANENYAREVMQLFTLGLTQLNPNGSSVLDQNQNPVPTYTQAIVTTLARAFTGWTYPTASGATPKNNNPAYYMGQMFAVESEHDTSSKPIFGNIAIPAGQTAEQDLDSVIDALMSQPTMAPFISRQLIQHLVTSNPSASYIQRVSQVFTNNGSGTAGDLKAVITAILTDPEARANDDSTEQVLPSYGHLREPILFMTNILRGLNGTVTSSSTLQNYASEMGENLFVAPSVFSYFSPQYRTEKGLLGPEFQIYSTQTVADRADIINTVLYGKLDKNTTVNLSPFIAQAGNTSNLLSYISSVFLHGGMSAALQQAGTSAVNAATTPTAKAQAALYVVLTSGEYQVIQ
ncbi:MAG TPA: DUF1800 domain-containing protein [Bryobacteraceae bacterium]|jgi:uncharacterized protein (DUF1800 family)|nr:DUF1800 domain-containing protein [Bryobacteraceae bacterium]